MSDYNFQAGDLVAVRTRGEIVKISTVERTTKAMPTWKRSKLTR